ncbi:MAG: UDP-N-acetylglucosamine 1-carboxyvinyltransferase [Alicyclobacillaceae bacterium]|nr:UDP-N-acetylglucosamine 1-carboxyvinyltransferase [Alicyclobacillaceae bacterium]
MDVFQVRGGLPLEGEVRVCGAKNAALPILAATTMVRGVTRIDDVPDLEDVRVMLEILRRLGAKAEFVSAGLVEVDATDISSTNVPDELMQKMRSSIFLMGPLLARFGEVRVSKPGGCVIGQRPIDYHLRGMRELGASIEERHGYIRCFAHRLVGTELTLDFPSVGATENLMMAAVLADGETVIENAAREPEIVDLARFLQSCGAVVTGAGEHRMVIHGVHHLSGASHRVIPDRIVAGTLLLAAAVTRGSVVLRNVEPLHLMAVLGKMRESGLHLRVLRDIIACEMSDEFSAVDIRTEPFPGFPTDLQAPFMSLSALAKGTSVFRENVFEARYKHVDELVRMGADISVDLRTAVVRGVSKMSGATVCATDLRGGAALVVAALAAEGLTELRGLQHIDRGYEFLDRQLSMLGADVIRTQVSR